jgi:hypothetical protein
MKSCSLQVQYANILCWNLRTTPGPRASGMNFQSLFILRPGPQQTNHQHCSEDLSCLVIQKYCLLLFSSFFPKICPWPNPFFSQRRWMMSRHILVLTEFTKLGRVSTRGPRFEMCITGHKVYNGQHQNRTKRSRQSYFCTAFNKDPLIV